MILTTAEASEAFGIPEGTLRQWVLRGQLQPLQRGVKPLRFREEDVAEAIHARSPESEKQSVREAATRWSELVASLSNGA